MSAVRPATDGPTTGNGVDYGDNDDGDDDDGNIAKCDSGNRRWVCVRSQGNDGV